MLFKAIVLIIVQLVIWIGIGAWLVNEFQIQNIFLKILVFGCTGVVSTVFGSLVSVWIGIIDKNGEPKHPENNRVEPDFSELDTSNRNEGQLLKALEEGSAVASWVIITCMEKNNDYFTQNPELLEMVNTNLNNGFDSADKKVAYSLFNNTIKKIYSIQSKLITDHKELVDGINRITELEKNIIKVSET